ncbi:aminotransferase class I/II-fold pyridoxal phosphate-dependent enzyme [Sulfurimonas sp. SAG-AH-194-I05]|nr:aminotransferase class I/II-fold pyridoxal phosphate-dependent enzyme [Sulfurimonas sp. SAG-AH-194-I05]MDF1875016.1 aminotransferase class I/II-fold pyridoxal phosphate-dependent enzyme [Sulfurimonas sp. SAG-AH-194-I05]
MYSVYLSKLYRPPLEKSKTKDFLCLDKNEPPFSAFDSLDDLFTTEDILNLREYPNLYEVYEKLATFVGVKIENLLLTQGSEQALKSVFEVFVEEGDEVVYYYPSFAMYDVYSYQKKANVVHLDFRDDGTMNVDDICLKVTEKTTLFSLISPHNFTGTALSFEEIKRITEHTKKTKTLFLLDEAYYHYENINTIKLLDNNTHVIITRTFSKALGIPGARVGYAISNRENIELLRKVKPIDEIDYLAGVIASKTLDKSEEILFRNVGQVKKWQSIFKSTELMNITYLDTKANFILLRSKNYDYHKDLLLKNKIIAKVKFDVKCLENCIRFSVVDDENMQMILDLFKQAN